MFVAVGGYLIADSPTERATLQMADTALRLSLRGGKLHQGCREDDASRHAQQSCCTRCYGTTDRTPPDRAINITFNTKDPYARRLLLP
jgi:hypothetical protein